MANGYKGLAVYKQTEIIHDFTMEFCRRYIDYKSRTKDQMEQAARSGKQNIPEGYAQKEHKSRLRLAQVARGSLEELLVDYQDFLRQKGLRFWEKEDPRAKEVRSFVYNSYNSYNTYKSYLDNPENAANTMICLINQTNAMLDKKLDWMEQDADKKDYFSPFQRWQWGKIEEKRQREKELDRELRENLRKDNKIFTGRGVMDIERAKALGLEEI